MRTALTEDQVNSLHPVTIKEDKKPSFEPGLVIKEHSLVVDMNGEMWWVFPETMAIFKA